ncbi:hypothetical protein HYC85_023977 [Camellia sinensis]|uniref:Uncharacterized protein n=1 Tax=Camellia sinensis TaxID=4442 RepID=A0A7J7GK01_CAMSI|nr:hypothetical protein HYC85_023977 [Camellia sinensis]
MSLVSCVSSFMLQDRVSIIGAHLTALSEAPVAKPAGIPVRTRPPITTHVLDVAHGSPASGIDVRLEMWRGNQACPTFGENVSPPKPAPMGLALEKRSRHRVTELAKARKLKLENSKLVRVFADLSQNYTTLISKPAYRTLFDSDASSIDESLLRQFDKEVKEQIMDYSIPLLFPFITILHIRNPGSAAPRTAKRRGGDGRTGGCVADSVILQLRIHVPNSEIPAESTEDWGAGLGIISGAGDSRGAFAGLWEFVKLSAASGVMLCLENWYYRILKLVTGNLENSTIAVDALSVYMSINGWEMMIPLAFFATTGFPRCGDCFCNVLKDGKKTKGSNEVYKPYVGLSGSIIK